MRIGHYLRLAAGLLACGALAASCSLDDSTESECRCVEQTDLRLFPECAEQIETGEREDPSNPFSARLPDCPSGATLPLRERTRPESVLLNIRTTFEGRSPTQYMEQLTEDFIFIPDPEDIGLHPEVYQAPEGYVPRQDTLWNREAERRFAVATLNPDVFQQIRFNRWFTASRDERIPAEDGFSETFIFPYEIELTGQDDQESFGLKGRIIIDLVTTSLENPIWNVQSWEDQRDVASAKRSWGEFRAEFSR